MREREIAAIQAKPGDKSTYLWDDRVRGLALRVRGSSKTFMLKAKIHGRTRWIRIGRYGELTLTQARQIARKHVAQIAMGGDPTEARHERTTVADLAAMWEAKEAPHLKPATRYAYRHALNAHILPRLGKRPLERVTRRDVERLHADLSAEHPTLANRVLATLSALWNHAERWEIAPPGRNPCRGVRRNKENSRDRFLSPTEIQRLTAILDGEDPEWADIIRLILLTGMRKSEALSLRWNEVDFDESVLRLPDSKSGAKLVQIPSDAVQLLQHRKNHRSGGVLVFPSERTGRVRKGMHKWWDRVRRKAGLWDVHIHDLRHTVATAALEAGHSMDLVGRMLGHNNIRSTAIYTHVRDSMARSVVEDAAKKIRDWKESA